MTGFTFCQEYYDTLKKLKNRKDKEMLINAILEFMFEDKEPKSLSDVVMMAFEIHRKSLELSKKRGMSGKIKPESKQNQTEIKIESNENQNEIKTAFDCGLISRCSQFDFSERENAPNEKERSKEKDNTLKRENERKKEIDKELQVTTGAHACAVADDFSKMTDEELISWGEGKSVDFDDTDAIASFYAWNEEVGKRAKDATKWSGKIIRNGDSLERLKSHAEIMSELGVSGILQETLKEFLRYCYANRHLVTNEKLADIISRLDEACGSDDGAKCEYIRRAIGGGFFDIKVGNNTGFSARRQSS